MTDSTPAPTAVLVEIVPLVGMALRTMRYSSVAGRRTYATKDVLTVSNDLKMLRADTVAIPAGVVQLVPLRNRSNHLFVNGCVDLRGPTMMLDPAITISISGTGPDPASGVVITHVAQQPLKVSSSHCY